MIPSALFRFLPCLGRPGASETDLRDFRDFRASVWVVTYSQFLGLSSRCLSYEVGRAVGRPVVVVVVIVVGVSSAGVSVSECPRHRRRRRRVVLLVRA